ncbi:MAG: hypothetical protein JRC88_10775 [Deltaproteobacteria bacterium]|nr:hypothetical protein [Deltaproteobacteria bacterium]
MAGYRVYSREEGQSYDYANPAWEGEETTCTIYDMDETKTYYFVVRAFDTEGFESDDSNEVCFEPGTTNNQPPISAAGPDQTVDEGQLVTLDGSNSTDPDDGIASYHWAQTGGAAVNLSDPNAQRPTFTASDVGDEGACLTFELTVIDHGGLESTDSCVVNVTWINEPPEANAGTDLTVDEGIVVTLDGSSSFDIDDGIASYLWTQISGQAVTLLDPTSSQPTFTTPDVGTEGASLNFNLVVTDAGGLQDTDSCIVNISWENQPPTAVVAEEYIEANQGTIVTLDGSNSTDPDDGIASYLWTQVDGDPVTLSDPTSNVTTFTAPESDQDGSNLTFQLTVKDAGGLQSTANCLVYITPEINEPPIANAGEDQVVYKDDVVILDGSRSSDPDGEIPSYQWTQISGTTVTLAGPTSVLPTFIAPDVGPVEETLTFRLTLTDTGGLQETDTCSVTVIPEAQTDNVAITSAMYSAAPKKLFIEAISDASAGSVTLTAFANYGMESVELGNLIYSTKTKVYSKTFRKVASALDTVTVTSSGGGSDTVQCIIK